MMTIVMIIMIIITIITIIMIIIIKWLSMAPGEKLFAELCCLPWSATAWEELTLTMMLIWWSDHYATLLTYDMLSNDRLCVLEVCGHQGHRGGQLKQCSGSFLLPAGLPWLPWLPGLPWLLPWKLPSPPRSNSPPMQLPRGCPGYNQNQERARAEMNIISVQNMSKGSKKRFV